MSHEQKLKKLSESDRKYVALTTDTNRRHALNHYREMQRRKGKNVCTWCGAEPCGHLWTRPGDRDIPGGERCCDRCSHLPVEGWQHTHTAWNGAASYPVCAVRMREGDVMYMRRDGVVMIVEMAVPAPPGSPTPTLPSVAFLGEDGGTALYTAGEGAAEHTNLWEKKAELDIVWLPIRMSAALAVDAERKQALADQLQRQADEWQRQEDIRKAEEKARLEASIERKSLEHETRIVMDEMAERGELADLDEDEDADDDAEEPDEAEGAPAVEASQVAKEPERRLTLAELKKPRPVKKAKGRPKRSKRQRVARKRQKVAWARQEAAQRLEVKRLERQARNSDESTVKDSEDE